jgi:hypothetical protein
MEDVPPRMRFSERIRWLSSATLPAQRSLRGHGRCPPAEGEGDRHQPEGEGDRHQQVKEIGTNLGMSKARDVEGRGLRTVSRPPGQVMRCVHWQNGL